MALFGFGKKEETESCCCGKPADGICCIKVLEQAASPVMSSLKMHRRLSEPWACP